MGKKKKWIAAIGIFGIIILTAVCAAAAIQKQKREEKEPDKSVSGESVSMQEIYQTITEDYYNRPLEKDEEGNYLLGDFYDNIYQVSIAPRQNFTILEENSGSGCIYLDYQADGDDFLGTYYLMPANEEYSVKDMTDELSYDYQAIAENENYEVLSRFQALETYDIDGYETVLDRMDYKNKETGEIITLRNYCMAVDEEAALVLQCMVTETRSSELVVSEFSDEELAQELFENIQVS